MKNLILILPLTLLCSIIVMQAVSAQVMIAETDSSQTEPSLLSLQFDSKSGAVQNLNRNNLFRNPNIDCTTFSPDSTSPRMKIFVPDTTLTAMPVFKPEPVDPGIFFPGSNCTKPESQN